MSSNNRLKWIAANILLFIICSGFRYFENDKFPPPYCDLEHILPFDGHGWYQNAEPMKKLIQAYQPKIVVEIGSWLGQSTRHIASLLPRDGKVYAVDHWLGSVEHQPGNSAWHPSLPQLYEQFLSNVIHTRLTHKIIPVRMTSLDAAKQLEVTPDLVYIDGAHDYESVYNDLSAWYPFVQGHGILCGDDWLWDTTRAAVEQFAKDNQLRIEVSHNFWCYEQL
jgi:cephalosporin hydroxylase